MTKREQQANETKQNIIRISKQLFLEKGFDNVKIDDIAKELSLSKGAVYHHFISKDSIILWIYRKEFDEIIQKQIEPYLEEEDTLTLILRCIDAILKCQELLSADIQKQYNRILATSSSSDETSFQTRHIYEIIKKIVENGKKKGEISDQYSIEFCVDYISASLQGVFSYWPINEDRIDLSSFAKQTARLIVKSLRD